MPAPLHDEIASLREEIAAAPLATADQVEAFRIDVLGRKSGRLTALFARIGEVPAEERRATGQALNAAKQAAEARIEEAQARLAGASGEGRAEIDLTLPGRPPAPLAPGSLHPLTQTLREIERIFGAFGFSVAEGPEIEDDWHNFTALNFPPNHPARDMQDTLFVEPPAPAGRGIVMRTHTSPVQIRVMQATEPPIRIIMPGRVYRNESISYKSFCLFHQVEGLYVDEGVTFADLKEILQVFARTLFGDDVRMRFRPSFFPFTEPSAEVDVWWEDENLEGGGRLAGDPRVRDGRPGRAAELRPRPRALHRLRLRHGRRADGPDQVWRLGHPHVLRERRAIPGAVLSAIQQEHPRSSCGNEHFSRLALPVRRHRGRCAGRPRRAADDARARG
jgi:phenylalanyl-tRNA synthetase alpha chain